mmetsp:Transcript_33306/g.76873  ORF Transcript_33306/g.76873 Transcript_33306/m.76873 type:complete len:151 (-) Transcript_33306:671-1123(-)
MLDLISCNSSTPLLKRGIFLVSQTSSIYFIRDSFNAILPTAHSAASYPAVQWCNGSPWYRNDKVTRPSLTNGGFDVRKFFCIVTLLHPELRFLVYGCDIIVGLSKQHDAQCSLHFPFTLIVLNEHFEITHHQWTVRDYAYKGLEKTARNF